MSNYCEKYQYTKTLILNNTIFDYCELDDEMSKNVEIVKLCIEKNLLKKYNELHYDMQKNVEIVTLCIEKSYPICSKRAVLAIVRKTPNLLKIS